MRLERKKNDVYIKTIIYIIKIPTVAELAMSQR